MMKSKVILVECKSYVREETEAAIKTGMELLGGIQKFFSKEEKILLKLNLLTKADPERAVTTHPSIFYGVGSYLKNNGFNNLSYGDSPGNPIGGMLKVAGACGVKEPAEQLGITAGNFNEGKERCYENGITEKNFIISNGILECDGIINICKMKTHQLERITGAAKNMFGAVYGINKGAFHAKYPEAEGFAEMLADLNNFIKARLHIMDGVVAMEGNGPQSGTPIDMGIILISEDPIALDTVFSKLIYLKPELVPTNRMGAEYGVGQMDTNNIEVVTVRGVITPEEAAEHYGKKDFDVYRGTDKKTQIRVLRPIQPLLEKKPYIIKEKCIRCGVCVDSCPVDKKAITMKGYPQYNYKLCIKCYCCQEMCPQKAIDVKTPVLTKLMDRNWRI